MSKPFKCGTKKDRMKIILKMLPFLKMFMNKILFSKPLRYERRVQQPRSSIFKSNHYFSFTSLRSFVTSNAYSIHFKTKNVSLVIVIYISYLIKY